MSKTFHPIVVGLGYGDEGKGATVDYLASILSETNKVVRFSGGAQAEHNVVHGDFHHTFRQFGSGIFSGIPTLALKPVVIDPVLLLNEAFKLYSLGISDPFSMLTVDAFSRVTTPIHRAINRAREIKRGKKRHGSIGIGFGETVFYDIATRYRLRKGDRVGNINLHTDAPVEKAPLVRTLTSRLKSIRALDALAKFAEPILHEIDDSEIGHESVFDIYKKLRDVAEELKVVEDSTHELEESLSYGLVVFEGSQGMILDQNQGFHPYTTWANISPISLKNKILAAGFLTKTIGVTRTYCTRHGPGPMPSEDSSMNFLELHNSETRWQGELRQGALDLILLLYSTYVAGGVDDISLTHFDAIEKGGGIDVVTGWGGLESYLYPLDSVRSIFDEPSRRRARAAFKASEFITRKNVSSEQLVKIIEKVTSARVTIASSGPDRSDRVSMGLNLSE